MLLKASTLVSGTAQASTTAFFAFFKCQKGPFSQWLLADEKVETTDPLRILHIIILAPQPLFQVPVTPRITRSYFPTVWQEQISTSP